MIPSYFIQLEKMLVTTSSGKIDRKALPAPDGLRKAGCAYEAPFNDLQRKLAEIWREVSGIDQIGINESFFELGGHSLKVMTSVFKINKEFGLDLPMSTLLKNPTIREMADYLSAISKAPDWNDEAPVMLLNQKKAKIFLLLPISGHGMVFRTPAGFIDSHSVYSFDFIESEDRIARYVKTMVQIQPEGDYRLLGYSVGGSLAFEVAQELERQGYQVSDLILNRCLFERPKG